MRLLDAQQLECQRARRERWLAIRLVDDQLHDTDELLACIPARLLVVKFDVDLGSGALDRKLIELEQALDDFIVVRQR